MLLGLSIIFYSAKSITRARKTRFSCIKFCQGLWRLLERERRQILLENVERRFPFCQPSPKLTQLHKMKAEYRQHTGGKTSSSEYILDGEIFLYTSWKKAKQSGRRTKSESFFPFIMMMGATPNMASSWN